jgi:hypothetical protein
MATVNAQSVEDFAGRIVYRYPSCRFQQAAGLWELTMSPGVKSLVNTDLALVYVVPSSGTSYLFFKIQWAIKVGVVFSNGAIPGNPLVFTESSFSKISANINYDGKSLQTEFSDKKIENFYTSPQLRAINVGNISLEPLTIAANLAPDPTRIAANILTADAYLVAMFTPIVTAYKK